LVDQSKVLVSGLSLNVSDTQNLEVSLWLSGNLVDSITGSSTIITQLKAIKASLQKLKVENGYLTT
jgi:hypothetical protein